MGKAIERRTTVVRQTLTIDSTDLLLGHNLALLVDELRLGPNVNISLQRQPTADDKTAGHMLATGTPDQLDVFERALNLYRHSVAQNQAEKVLIATMNDFFILQARRYKRTA